MALVKGICKNFGECDMADNKVEQEAEKSNFICEECGKPLHPVEGGGNSGNGGGKGPKGPNKKLIALIAGGILGIAAIGGGIALTRSGDNDNGGVNDNDSTTFRKPGNPQFTLNLNQAKTTLKVGETDTLTATITPEGTSPIYIWKASKDGSLDVRDGIVKAVKEGVGKIRVQAIVGKDTLSTICKYIVEQEEGPVPTPPNPSYGRYNGDRNSQGLPHGFGDLIFTKRKLVMGDTYAEPDYKIRNGRYKNGKLQSGTLYDADGNKVCFIGPDNNL